MPLSTTTRNGMLNGLRNVAYQVAATYLSLHTAHPGTTGTSEVTGGSYARQLTALDAAASGATQNTDAKQISGMPDTTAAPVVAIGLWDAVTAGTFLGWEWLTTARDTFTAAAATDAFTAPAHGLANTNRVAFRAAAGGTLPAGIDETTLYYVVGATTDTFQVSTTSGGAAVNLTADGAGIVMLVTPQGATAGHTFTIAAGALDIELG